MEAKTALASVLALPLVRDQTKTISDAQFNYLVEQFMLLEEAYQKGPYAGRLAECVRILEHTPDWQDIYVTVGFKRMVIVVSQYFTARDKIEEEKEKERLRKQKLGEDTEMRDAPASNETNNPGFSKMGLEAAPKQQESSGSTEQKENEKQPSHKEEETGEKTGGKLPTPPPSSPAKSEKSNNSEPKEDIDEEEEGDSESVHSDSSVPGGLTGDEFGADEESVQRAVAVAESQGRSKEVRKRKARTSNEVENKKPKGTD